MASYYPYLVASLPMLHFDMKPPISLERFLELAGELIPLKDSALLRSLPEVGLRAEAAHFPSIVRQWVAFDTGLRNALAKARARRLHIEASLYLRAGGLEASSLEQVALAAVRSASPSDAEKALDEARWKALDELSQGHYFDIESLIVYAYKLKILQRWEAVRTAEAGRLFEQMIAVNG
jgi:hypothetical protein